jgi:hypothetical protein
MSLQLNGEAFKPAVGKPLYFEAKIGIDDVDKDDVFIGLAISDTTPLASSDSIGFRVDHDGDLDCLITQNSTEYAADTGVNMADCATAAGTLTRVAFYWDGVSSVYFYVNGVLTNTFTDNGTTILVPDDQTLSPAMFINTTDTGADSLFVDYIEVCQAR